MKEIVETLALDVGFAQTKIYTGSKQAVVISATACPPALHTNAPGLAAPKMYVVGGRPMLVGSDALAPGLVQLNVRDADWLLSSAPYLALHAADVINADTEAVKQLGIGLPIGFLGLADQLVQAVQPIFPQASIRVFPQAAGALTAYVAERSSQVNPDDQGLLVDIGGNTVICLTHKGYQAGASGTYQFTRLGVLSCAEDLAQSMAEKVGKLHSPIKASQALRDGYIRGRGQGKIDLSAEINDSRQRYIQRLLSAVSESYGSLIDELDNLLICGGGANLIRGHIPAEWQGIAKIIDDPEFANVRGYFLALNRG